MKVTILQSLYSISLSVACLAYISPSFFDCKIFWKSNKATWHCNSHMVFHFWRRWERVGSLGHYSRMLYPGPQTRIEKDLGSTKLEFSHVDSSKRNRLKSNLFRLTVVKRIDSTLFNTESERVTSLLRSWSELFRFFIWLVN